MVDFTLDPARTALINVDMQVAFVDGSPIAAPDGPKLVPLVNRLSAACRKAGILVVHTAHTLRADLSNAGVHAEMEPMIGDGVFSEGSLTAALHRDLEVLGSDVVLKKPRFGAFHGTDLELILRARGIDSIIVTGICTNVCCESTAREAAVRDFKVFFTSDGTATSAMQNVSSEELQRATCASIATVFGQVLSVDDVIAKIEGAAWA